MGGAHQYSGTKWMNWNVAEGENSGFLPGLLQDKSGEARIPAHLSSSRLSEWLALVQGQPWDLSHPDFPSMWRI